MNYKIFTTKEKCIKAIQEAIENPIKDTTYGPDNEYLFKVKFQSKKEMEYFYDTLDENENAYNYLFESRGYCFHTSMVDDDEPFTENCYCTYYGLLINVIKDYHEVYFDCQFPYRVDENATVAQVLAGSYRKDETIKAILAERVAELKKSIDNGLSGVKPTAGIADSKAEAFNDIDLAIEHLSKVNKISTRKSGKDQDDINNAVRHLINLEKHLNKLAIEVTKSLTIKK